jgi:predicted dinucleotide-binding enzyme
MSSAATFGEVVMLSVQWSRSRQRLVYDTPRDGKIVSGTTNHFGPRGVVELPGGVSAAEYNQRCMQGTRLVKAYHTLTAGFQASAAGRTGPDRVVMFYAGEDAEAKSVVARLIDDSGFEPEVMGGWATVRSREAPRRPRGVYGEEYHLAEAQAFVARVAPRV